jgi:hypothetical protein
MDSKQIQKQQNDQNILNRFLNSKSGKFNVTFQHQKKKNSQILTRLVFLLSLK